MTVIPDRTTPAEKISGLIERVTFFNGYCVLRARIKGHRE
jgi:hypothetical protein